MNREDERGRVAHGLARMERLWAVSRERLAGGEVMGGEIAMSNER